MTSGELAATVAAHPAWYHTLELAPGVVTPGWFDHRSIVDGLPWPDVRGKRCLDVGTFDGFYAFEMERRGAAEVVAVDVADHEQWDWPPDVRAVGQHWMDNWKGVDFGGGFRLAKEALGSNVERVEISVYDLNPERLGEFDVVVSGTLLLHLRDPIAAVEAIRSVCRSWYLTADQINLRLSVTARKMEVARLIGWGPAVQWWEPNCAGHRQLLFAGGFEVERTVGPYCLPFGVSHPPRGRQWRVLATSAFRRLMAGGNGVPHQAVLARPRF